MKAGVNLSPFAARNHTSPPPRLGQRYGASRFLPEAGNTVVCHLDVSAQAHAAVLRARTRMQTLPGAECFLYTPVESLHMTIFEGVIEIRRTPDAWPAHMERSASVEDVTTSMMARLKNFVAPPKFSVRVKAIQPTGLALCGVSAEDEVTMRAWRDALTEPFGYRHKEHENYRFHMTFAYPKGWLTDDCLSIWEVELGSIFAELCETAPVIPLNSPAFCKFADMTRFDELLILQK